MLVSNLFQTFQNEKVKDLEAYLMENNIDQTLWDMILSSTGLTKISENINWEIIETIRKCFNNEGEGREECLEKLIEEFDKLIDSISDDTKKKAIENMKKKIK